MRTIYTLQGFDEKRVETIMDEIKNSPDVEFRVVYGGDFYFAIDDVSKLEAISRLGISPYLIEIDEDCPYDYLDLDWDLRDFDLEPDYKPTIGWLIGELMSHHASVKTFGVYRWDDDGTIIA